IFSKIGEKRPDLRLVLVGKIDYFYAQVKKFAETSECSEKIIFPGYVKDEDLAIFYRQAEAYIFTSLYEGFGLPPLEAMAQNCPAISTDKACMPEILGEAAYYFNPENENEASEKILEVINDKNLQNQLILKGQKQIAKYSWNKCAHEISELYNRFI
ncbi:MAG: glycosyltransferase family 1 protein, partial [Candidatus Magasanikbacteria bacterium]|nr:glycosyltransferase family 1 protein [Candidatus Magasanikbacteria bacterium]